MTRSYFIKALAKRGFRRMRKPCPYLEDYSVMRCRACAVTFGATATKYNIGVIRLSDQFTWKYPEWRTAYDKVLEVIA